MMLKIATNGYFQENPIPQQASLAGWAALVHALKIQAPVRQFSCVSERHVGGNRRIEGRWEIFDKRYLPEDTVLEHLRFALRYENIDLLILKRIFDVMAQDVLVQAVRSTPNSAITRRLWFFYEILTGKLLDIDDAPVVTAVNALD